MIRGYGNMRCGLLGKTLGHSVSPILHGALADYGYRLFEVPEDGIDAFMKNEPFDGLNVTIPHKIRVLPYLSELTPTAKQAGAVNCIKRKNGVLVGHNSDVFGFSYLLDAAGVSLSSKKVLILGSGGASHAVRVVAERQGAKEIVTVSRTGADNYENLSRHADADILVNATPVGMYPRDGEMPPVSLDAFPRLSFVADVIYRPLRTCLLEEAEKRGIPHANGLLMLAAQAKEAAEFFTGESIPDSEIPRAAKAALSDLRNVVLIGMPGSGKTTVGKILAERLNRRFVDLDDEIVQSSGMSIGEIFEKYGETYFRELETRVLKEKVRGLYGCVIATGGGTPMLENNLSLLRRNGRLYFLDRPLDELVPTGDRPLASSCGKLKALFSERYEKYVGCADEIIKATGNADETAKMTAERISK